MAFLLISIAMLGLGASGSYLAVSKNLHVHGSQRLLVKYSVLFAVFSIIFIVFGAHLPVDMYVMFFNVRLFLTLFLLFSLMIFLPFFFAGLTIGLALKTFAEQISRLYFADLLGAGIGCVLANFMIIGFGAPGGVLACAILGLVAALFFGIADKGKISRPVIVGIAVTALFLGLGRKAIEVNTGLSKFESLVKFQYKQAKIVYSEWTPIGRIDVQQLDDNSSPYYVLGLGKNVKGAIPKQKLVHIDGTSTTTINEFDGDFSKLEIFDNSLYSAAYRIINNSPDVLIIGAGGGTDVLVALKNGAKSIVGVELNKPTIKAVKEIFNDFAGGIYNHPSVKVVHAEGRSFVKRNNERYDLIQLTGVDTYAALAMGSYTLAENYLYTVEAVIDFINRTKKDGIISFIRWCFDPPRESLKLVTISASALRKLKLKDEKNRIAVLKADKFANVLIKPSGFTEDDVKKLEAFSQEAGIEPLHLPHRPKKKNPFSEFLSAKSRRAFYKNYDFNIKPSTDDSPFFYNYHKWKFMPLEKYGSFSTPHSLPFGQILLLFSIIQAIVLSALFIILPLALFKRQQIKGSGKFSLLVYFTAIGLAFMFVELAALQKFALFLEHPAYSTSTVLFSMLVFAGIGSYISGRMKLAAPIRVGVAASVVVVVIIFFAVGLDALLNALIGLPLTVKAIIATFLLAPLALAMGFPFPSGMTTINRIHNGFVPWAWGINGCASVVGSTLAVLLAMLTNFKSVFALAAVLYVIASLALFRLNKLATHPASQTF